MSDFTRSPSGGNCSACGAPVLLNQRRCPGCGAWQRPWSTGGKPSRWARYEVGGSGRPEDWGARTGAHTEVSSSVWVTYGNNKDRVRQVTASGEDARSGAHQPIRGAARAPKAAREAKPPRESRRARKSK